MNAIRDHERVLAERMARGLAAIPGVRVWGIADPSRFADRTPTFAVTLAGIAPRAVAETLAEEAIFVWDGDFYAQGLIERLGLAAEGGVVRLGLVHYNTADEVDRTLDALERVAATNRPARRTPIQA